MTAPLWELRRAEFVIDKIPPSKNQTNWKTSTGKMSTKIRWRPILTEPLERLGLPKPIPRVPSTPLFVFVSLRFGPRSQDPETPNYEPAVKECLLDVLRVSDEPEEQGWIDDDKNDQVWIAVDIMEERGDRGMMVVLEWMEPVESKPFFDLKNQPAQLPT